MRIAYVAWHIVDQESGVLKKIATQIRTWSVQNHQTRFFALGPSTSMNSAASDLDSELHVSPGLGSRVPAARRLVQSVLRWDPDLVYFRFGAYLPGLGRLLCNVPTILELNTDDLPEYRKSLPYWQFVYHRLTRNVLLKKCAGMVAVTNEIASRFAPYEKPLAVIANGIDLEFITPTQAPDNHQPRLVFIGLKSCFWHGVDKILTLAEYFPDWEFDLIGFQSTDFSSELPSNVRAHGELRLEQYLPIMHRADIALGTLALDRKAMDEACALKVREYLAFGLPTILGHSDTDFPEGSPFLLQLPNTEDNVTGNFGRIEKFVSDWKGRRVDRQSISHLDTRVKEKARLEFFLDTLNAKRP